MTNGKKYDVRIVQDKKTWTAEIIRQVTSKKTVVSKCQTGLATEADAQAWGEGELKIFMANLQEQNKRRSKNRK